VGAAGKGKSIQSLLDLQPGENVRAILPVRDLEEEGKFIFFATRNGTVKKTPLKDFSNVMSRGIIAIGIDDGDELVKARITDGHQIIFLATHLGMAIRFDESDVRSMAARPTACRCRIAQERLRRRRRGHAQEAQAGRVPDSLRH